MKLLNLHDIFKQLHGICIDRKQRYILTDQEKHNVTIFGNTGKLLSFGGFGHRNDQFKSPRYVTTSPNENNIYVSDHHNHCIKVFDDSGTFLFKFGSKGRGDGQMSFPEGIAFLDWANGLLVADEGNNRVSLNYKL
jgi:tripartite motif-containing protein 2/3